MHYLWGPWVECIHLYLDISGKLCLFSSCINSSSSVQFYGRTCHRSMQTFDSSGTMLEGGSLASLSDQHVGRHSWHCPIVKELVMEFLVGEVLESCHFCIQTCGCSEICVVQTRVLFLSLSGSGEGNLTIYSRRLPAVLERMGRLVCLRDYT